MVFIIFCKRSYSFCVGLILIFGNLLLMCYYNIVV